MTVQTSKVAVVAVVEEVLDCIRDASGAVVGTKVVGTLILRPSAPGYGISLNTAIPNAPQASEIRVTLNVSFEEIQINAGAQVVDVNKGATAAFTTRAVTAPLSALVSGEEDEEEVQEVELLQYCRELRGAQPPINVQTKWTVEEEEEEASDDSDSDADAAPTGRYIHTLKAMWKENSEALSSKFNVDRLFLEYKAPASILAEEDPLAQPPLHSLSRAVASDVDEEDEDANSAELVKCRWKHSEATPLPAMIALRFISPSRETSAQVPHRVGVSFLGVQKSASSPSSATDSKGFFGQVRVDAIGNGRTETVPLKYIVSSGKEFWF